MKNDPRGQSYSGFTGRGGGRTTFVAIHCMGDAFKTVVGKGLKR